ncbi:hypothetical protein [Maribellus mangrovi]|uniref:hypothetical protein n=1 Tax=Maribellus mangrovi TaxID=3133146 RepID=UPI0030ED067E
MKIKFKIATVFLTFAFLFSGLASQAQHDAFLIEGRVVDENGIAIPDVYVVNLRNHDRDISRDNGVFTIWVVPSDSLVLSHIAYTRRVASVHSILVNPLITLISEHVNVPEIRISPEQISDLDRANKNMEFINEYKVPEFSKISSDQQDPVTSIVTEHNSLLRSEATSLSLVRFSPSDVIGKVFVKARNKDHLTDYSSTRKVKTPPKEVEETEGN